MSQTSVGTPKRELVAAIRAAAGAVNDPEITRPLGELNMVRTVDVEAGRAQVGIVLTIAGCPMAKRIERDVREAVLGVPGVSEVSIDLGVMNDEERAELSQKLNAGRPRRVNPFTPDSLTRVIAVTSGKGGVGKSTVAANVAAAAAQRGLKVGLIDADVHGFSIPALMGLVDEEGIIARPTQVADMMLPPIAHQVRVVSIGSFLPPGQEDSAVSWRGPLLHRAVEQFLSNVHFGDLDLLVVDLPPGTGDVGITVGQLLPHAEVLVVTTPQRNAAGVAERSGQLARQLGQKVIGVVETMAEDASGFAPFGSGGGVLVAERLATSEEHVAVLGKIPFSMVLRENGDNGTPVVVAAPEDPGAEAFQELTQRIISRPRGLTGRALTVSVK